MSTLYDPPAGWRYGFPKPYKPLEGESLEQTLIRDGYPANAAADGAKHCRFIGMDLAVRYSDVSESVTLPANDNSPAGVTISRLQAAHIERQDEWCPDQKPDLSFRGNEMAGEVGEACNVIKKLERERHGWKGSRDTVDHLGQELADVVHTAVLCAITAGIDLEPYVVSKFNETSEKVGLNTRLVA